MMFFYAKNKKKYEKKHHNNFKDRNFNILPVVVYPASSPFVYISECYDKFFLNVTVSVI